jgi:hypothetical protein
MKREHLNGLYRIDVYFMARQLADLPLFLLTPTIFMVIFYFMALVSNFMKQFRPKFTDKTEKGQLMFINIVFHGHFIAIKLKNLAQNHICLLLFDKNSFKIQG